MCHEFTKFAGVSLADPPERKAICMFRLKNYIIAIKSASALKKPGQLPITRGSEGLLPSVNTL
jgi:hypothetical protein